MNHGNIFFRIITVVLLFAMVAGLFPMSTVSATPSTKATDTAQTRAYYDICKSIPEYEACNSMQGMAVLGDYIYTAKVNKENTLGTVFRTNRFDGTTTQMIIDGGMSADYFSHANDMCAAQVGSDSYLFITSMKTSVDALICFKISETALTLVGIFDVYTAGGSKITCSGLDVYEVKGNVVTLLVAQGTLVFKGTMDMTAPADLYCPLGFEIDKTAMLETARQACGNAELEMTVQGSGFYDDTYYMPLTLHHNHSTQIKPDNHADSTSVIVAFPNIQAAMAVMDRSVKASLSETVYVPDAGEMFFEIESVDFADGIVYFSTNRVRIDHSVTAVSLLLDEGVDMGIFTRRAAFRQDGLYILTGANATDYFMYDPGAEDGHLLAGKVTAGTNTYFGLESNEEGFYYIRSMLTKEYLTVNADGTVTKSAKKPNDPSQLFCLTQVNWPNEPGHVAIISMFNYQYLNNESGTTKAVTTTSGKTYRLKKVKDTATLETYLFDYKLYTACYPTETAGMTEAQAKAHFQSTGKAKGYIASIFFDPEYYLANNPDVAAHASYGTYAGAYNHFRDYGFWEGRQGSLFFSMNEYLHSGNDKLKGGDYPDKLFYIWHFYTYGANESLTRSDRYGSDEFAIHEVVAKFGLNPTGGYDFLVDYIRQNVQSGGKYLYGLNPDKSVLCDHVAKVTATKSATCTQEGSITTSCCECLQILETAKLPKTAHTAVTDPAVAPTDTQTGLTAGSHCTVCNLILDKQTVIPALQETYRGSYDLCADLPLIENCFSMQGMALLGDYIYTAKINGANDKAVIFRTSRLDGSTVAMTIDSKAYGTNLKHANDLCAATVAGKSYLFVATLKNGAEGMVAYRIEGTSLTTVGVYGLYQVGGAAITASGINTYTVNGNKVILMITSGSYTFQTTVDMTAAPGNLACDFMFKLDSENMLAIAQEATGQPDTEITIQGAGYGNNTFYVPLGISHDEINADNHRDHTSVILVYPNIDEAIAGKQTAVKTTVEYTIYLPHSGDVFSEVESVAYADGIVYININRIRIDKSITCAVSFLTDPQSCTKLLDQRAAFCQDGLYLLRGSSATEYLMVDPGASDGHLTVQKTTPGISAYFGFESNEQGYYYIRSHLSGLYLTVNADGSVTQSAKKANDVSQLWALTQVDWPNNPLKVAIISMRNFGYLNLDSATMTVLTNHSGKTFLLEEYLNTAGLEADLFDYALYTACYPEETKGMTAAQAKAHWVSTGRAKGYVASVFFDPKYYLANETDVADAYGTTNYEAAYEHFLTTGFWEGRQGSLFFDCKDYVSVVNFKYTKEYYPNKEKFVRHFYLYGANESLQRTDVVRCGSEEFDLRQVVAEFGLNPSGGYDFLVDYISRNVRLSSIKNKTDLENLLFDWEYYASRYPELTEANVKRFAGNTYAEKLRSHWNLMGIAEGRTASPYFDVTFYRAKYTDVGATNAEAYAHFVESGFWSHRAGSEWYDGTNYLYGLYPPKAEVCAHSATVTAKGEATCATGTFATTYCCFCSKVIQTTALPSLGHHYTSKVTSPTCTAQGYTTHTCSRCSNSYKDTYTPATGHSYTSKVTTAATCTTAGVKTFTCSKCNHSYTEAIAATGHTEVVDKAVAATCTTAGKTEGSHCSVCNTVIKAQTTVPATGHSYTSKVTTAATCTKDGVKTFTCSKCNHSYTETIAATGHTEVADKAVEATCTTAGKTEGSHCSVCNAVIKAQTNIPATGHSYSIKSNGNGTHTATCARCNDSYTENHSFTNGTCNCGDNEITLDESVKILHTLDLASDISVTFAVQKTALASYDSYYLECVLLEYSGNELIGTSTVQIQPDVSGNYYYFTLTGITAVRMGDMVEAQLHMTKGEKDYISKTDSYSVATYAYGMLNSSKDVKMLTLCADLLRYGAEAQSFKGYRTDSLVDANMTETHRSYLSNTEALTFSATDSYLGDLAAPTITWVGKTLALGSKVGMKFVFNTKNYNGDISKLSMKVTYQGTNGETKTVTLMGAEAYGTTGQQYSFTFYGLLASELRTIVDVAIYEGNTQLSETLRYSAESYATKTNDTTLESLTCALFAYSDSAKAFFAK